MWNSSKANESENLSLRKFVNFAIRRIKMFKRLASAASDGYQGGKCVGEF